MESPQPPLEEHSPSTAQQSPGESPSPLPTPSTFPRVSGKSVFCSERALVAHLAAVVLVASPAFILWAIFSHDWKPEGAVVRKAKRCCLREVEELYHHVNFSISPCRSLYNHVCGHYAVNPEPVSLKDFRHHSERDLYTAPNTTFGNAVHAFFQSCLRATANADSQGGPTATAYLDVLRPTLAELNTKNDIVLFLLRMTVKYNIQPVPTLTIYGRGGVPRGFYNTRMEALRKFGIFAIILQKTRPHIEDVIAGRYKGVRENCLRTINKRMSLNVTLEAMETLEVELDVDNVGKYIFSNFSLVSQLVPPLNVGDWGRIMLNVGDASVPKYLYHGNVQLLSKAFSILLNDTRRPDSIVFFIFEAVSHLLLEHLKASMWTNADRYFSYCSRELNEYSRMRAVTAVAENSKSPRHDATFRNMFIEIVTAISRRVERTFPAEDQQRLSSYLRSLRILLPSDIYPLNKWMPPLSSDYVRNILTLFKHDWSASTYMPPPGITRTMVTAISLGKIVAFNNTVLIPLDVYGALTFGNGTERLVFLSSVGVQLADVVWREIFYFGANLSTATSQVLRGYKSCQRGLNVLLTRRWAHFVLPLLSVETAMELARDPLWFGRFQAVTPWATSRCQLFYLLFIYHHYCPGNDPGKPALAMEAQYIASVSKDFRAAFRCREPKVPVHTCYLNPSN